MTQQNIKRRTLVKGAAWAAPAVAASAAVPAYAASACMLGHHIPRGSYQGVDQNTNQKENAKGPLTLQGSFGLVEIWGIPAGVTVKKITSTIYYARRTDTENQVIGSFSPSESYTYFLVKDAVKDMVAGRKYKFNDYNNIGVTNELTFLGNIGQHQHPDKVTRDTWAVQKIWTPNDSVRLKTGTLTGISESACNERKIFGLTCDVGNCFTGEHGSFTVHLGSFKLIASNVMFGTINQVCNALKTYTVTDIEFSDPSYNIHSVAEGKYKDDQCTNW